MVLHSLQYVCGNVQFGHKNLHVTLPRMLTVWFEYSDKLQLLSQAQKSSGGGGGGGGGGGNSRRAKKMAAAGNKSSGGSGGNNGNNGGNGGNGGNGSPNYEQYMTRLNSVVRGFVHEIPGTFLQPGTMDSSRLKPTQTDSCMLLSGSFWFFLILSGSFWFFLVLSGSSFWFFFLVLLSASSFWFFCLLHCASLCFVVLPSLPMDHGVGPIGQSDFVVEERGKCTNLGENCRRHHFHVPSLFCVENIGCDEHDHNEEWGNTVRLCWLCWLCW